MKRHILISFCLLAIITRSNSQNPITICESTLKVAPLSTEMYYCGFSKGDQLIFDFEEINSKELKEIEIYQYPSSTLFMDYKSSKITYKVINIPETGIYAFRFYNSAILGRICKYKVIRVPVAGTENFNSTVSWITKYDTTYSYVDERYLVRKDTTIVSVTDQIAKVHSKTNSAGNTSYFNFILPEYTVAWSYYIGVNQEGQAAFNQATVKLTKNLSPLVSRIPGYGPLAALALNSVSFLTSISSGENVKYWLVDGNNLNLLETNQTFHYIKKGDVINDFSRVAEPLSGQYFLYMINDNEFQAIDVLVKITAICVKDIWGIHNVKKMNVSSKKIPILQK